MQFLNVLIAAATAAFPSPTSANHLLAQLDPLEKNIASIDHQIAKAEYQAKNPSSAMFFESLLQIDWFGHTCGQECAEKLKTLKDSIQHLHLARTQNKFKEVLQIASENPELVLFKDNDGNTILHQAAASNQANLTLALLCRFPELIVVKNKLHQTPVEISLTKNPRRIFLFVRVAYAQK